MAGASKRERGKKTKPQLAVWWRQLKKGQPVQEFWPRSSGRDLAEGTEPFILFFGWWVLSVWVEKPDGIYRRMAEHKVYVCLKTSVKSISGLRGKSRRKRLKTGRSCHLGSLTLWIHAAFRIFIVVDVLCLQDRDGGTEGAFPTPLDRIPSPRSSFFICRYDSIPRKFIFYLQVWISHPWSH